MLAVAVCCITLAVLTPCTAFGQVQAVALALQLPSGWLKQVATLSLSLGVLTGFSL